MQNLISLGTNICWQSKNATSFKPLNFLAIEAGKHASKSLVTVKVIDKICPAEILFLFTSSSISSLTATSISNLVFFSSNLMFK